MMENTVIIKKKKKKKIVPIIKSNQNFFAKNRSNVITRNTLRKNQTVYIYTGKASITFKKKMKNTALYNHNLGQLAPTKKTGYTMHLSEKNLKKKGRRSKKKK